MPWGISTHWGDFPGEPTAWGVCELPGPACSPSLPKENLPHLEKLLRVTLEQRRWLNAFVSKSSYPKRVNRGSWDGDKVRTRGNWLEATWRKQNQKTVGRTGKPGALQSMGVARSPTGLSDWTELREVKAGNLPMNFMLIILSSSPISFE